MLGEPRLGAQLADLLLGEECCVVQRISRCREAPTLHRVGERSPRLHAAGVAALGVAVYLYVDAEAKHAEQGGLMLMPNASARGGGLDVVWVY